MTSHGNADDELGRLMDEFLSRKRDGEFPSLSEFAQQNPELEREIRKLFPALIKPEHARPDENDPQHTKSSGTAAPVQLGDYRIIREIGRGGMGVVYEAEQESLGRRVALKILPHYALLDNQQLQRFQREARRRAASSHEYRACVQRG